MGLSYERNHLAENLFTGSNSALINLFKQLGPGILRIGGGSVDTTPWVGTATPAPGEEVGTATVSALFDFLDATGWTVLYGLPMLACPTGTYLPSPACSVITPAPPQQGTATSQQDEATAVLSSAGGYLYGFEIGQEPDAYAIDGVPGFFDPSDPGHIDQATYTQFLPQWQAAYGVVHPAVPAAMFTGPAASAGTKGVMYYAAPFAEPSPAGARGEFGLLTQHYYFAYANGMNCGRATSSPWTTGPGTASSPTCSGQLAGLLAPDPALVGGSGMLQRLKTAAAGAGVPYRMAEGNSFSGGGLPGISDSQASALWLLDYLFANAAAGSTGVNLHGGGDSDSYTPIADNSNGVVCGSTLAQSLGITCQKGGDATIDPGVRPEYYALLMFALAGQGPVVSATVSSPLDLTAYAITPGAETTTNVVIVNKDATKTAQVSVNLGYAAPGATVTVLTAPSLTATNGLTLAGATISPDSPWAGNPVNATASNGHLTVDVPPASAALVRGRAAIVVKCTTPAQCCRQAGGTWDGRFCE